LAVHEVLDNLAKDQPAQAEVVELRYFAGMTNEETAQVLDVSVATAQNCRTFARIWIFNEIKKAWPVSLPALNWKPILPADENPPNLLALSLRYLALFGEGPHAP
jgi:hypothetical protein